MIGVIGKEKKIKDPIVESQKIVDNHIKAATCHESAALHHREAAKHQMEGNSIMACGCNCKAIDQTNLAKKIQKKNKKKQKALV